MSEQERWRPDEPTARTARLERSVARMREGGAAPSRTPPASDSARGPATGGATGATRLERLVSRLNEAASDNAEAPLNDTGPTAATPRAAEPGRTGPAEQTGRDVAETPPVRQTQAGSSGGSAGPEAAATGGETAPPGGGEPLAVLDARAPRAAGPAPVAGRSTRPAASSGAGGKVAPGSRPAGLGTARRSEAIAAAPRLARRRRRWPGWMLTGAVVLAVLALGVLAMRFPDIGRGGDTVARADRVSAEVRGPRRASTGASEARTSAPPARTAPAAPEGAQPSDAAEPAAFRAAFPPVERGIAAALGLVEHAATRQPQPGSGAGPSQRAAGGAERTAAAASGASVALVPWAEGGGPMPSALALVTASSDPAPEPAPRPAVRSGDAQTPRGGRDSTSSAARSTAAGAKAEPKQATAASGASVAVVPWAEDGGPMPSALALVTAPAEPAPRPAARPDDLRHGRAGGATESDSGASRVASTAQAAAPASPVVVGTRSVAPASPVTTGSADRDAGGAASGDGPATETSACGPPCRVAAIGPRPAPRPDAVPGAATAASAPRVVIHYTTADGPERARALAARLDAAGLGGAEIRSVDFEVSRDNARFFWPQDRRIAKRALRALGLDDAALRDFTDYATSPRHGTVELWLAR